MTEGGDYFNEKCLTAVKYVGCKSYNNANYYMALACGRYNARSDCLIVTEL